jgi:hypothetical protein
MSISPSLTLTLHLYYTLILLLLYRYTGIGSRRLQKIACLVKTAMRLGPPRLMRPAHLKCPVFCHAGQESNNYALVCGSKVPKAGHGHKDHLIVYQRVPKLSAHGAYFVDCPRDIFSGEKFRVYLAGRELIIVCPDITITGQRIIVQLYPPS